MSNKPMDGLKLDSNGKSSCDNSPHDKMRDLVDITPGPNISERSQMSSIPVKKPSFDQFACQIQTLCQSLWSEPTEQPSKSWFERFWGRPFQSLGFHPTITPQTAKGSMKFTIENLRGGSYNRVAGITMTDENDVVKSRMVIRVPHMGVSWTPQSSIVLSLLKFHAELPVPTVLALDSTDNNPMESPYEIQTMVPGHDLESKAQSYPNLSHSQKLLFIEEYCRVVSEMQRVQHPWAGEIRKDSHDTGDQFTIGPLEVFGEKESLVTMRTERLPFFKIRPFGDADGCSAGDLVDGSHPRSPVHFFDVQFARWKNFEYSIDPSDIWLPCIWQELYTMVHQMDEFGCLDCEYYCLSHCDLDPRNIMVEIQSGKPTITGIIDWDLAIFAPDWMSCKPPMWIWNWLDGGSEDESKANDDPPTAEQQELKDYFDELIGFDFTYNAYQPHFRLARRLFDFARYGLTTAERRSDAEKVLEEWKTLYAQKQATSAEQENEGLAEEADEGPKSDNPESADVA